MLLALKLGAWQDLRGPLKGEKDIADIAALLPLVGADAFTALVSVSPIPKERAQAIADTFDQASIAVRRLTRWQPRPKTPRRRL